MRRPGRVRRAAVEPVAERRAGNGAGPGESRNHLPGGVDGPALLPTSPGSGLPFPSRESRMTTKSDVVAGGGEARTTVRRLVHPEYQTKERLRPIPASRVAGWLRSAAGWRKRSVGAVVGVACARHRSSATSVHRPACHSVHYLTFRKTLAPRGDITRCASAVHVESVRLCFIRLERNTCWRTVGVRVNANRSANSGEIGARRTGTCTECNAKRNRRMYAETKPANGPCHPNRRRDRV